MYMQINMKDGTKTGKGKEKKNEHEWTNKTQKRER
jgi:hypothetical protein